MAGPNGQLTRGEFAISFVIENVKLAGGVLDRDEIAAGARMVAGTQPLSALLEARVIAAYEHERGNEAIPLVVREVIDAALDAQRQRRPTSDEMQLSIEFFTRWAA